MDSGGAASGSPREGPPPDGGASASTTTLLRVFWPYLHPHRGRIAGAVVALLMVAGALLTMGRGLAYLVDEGLGRQDPALLDRAVVGTALIALVLAAGSYLRTTLVNQIGERVLADVRRAVFAHLMTLPPAWYETARTGDVLARIIYGFRLSVLFAIIVSVMASAIGIFVGAVQGYLGGRTDLLAQRLIEIWGATPSLYIIIIVSAIWRMDFWLLVFLMTLFSWTALVGVVRAEFLRARNFEYVQAAKALGVRPLVIMFRHVLPNAMVATLTMLPFIVTGAIGSLAALDFLGFGLPSSAPSLGELTLQAKQNLQAPWLGLTAFAVFAMLLALLVFIFEGVRDAFDPRKTFT